MPQKLYHVQLSNSERRQLERCVKQGKPAARAVTRARNQARKTVQWTFTQTRAREKLKRKYSMIKN
jgi:hypothetical protein